MQRSPFSTVYFLLGYFWFRQSLTNITTVLCVKTPKVVQHLHNLVLVADKFPLIAQIFTELVSKSILRIELARLSPHIVVSHVRRPELEPPPQQ